jgi:predicted MFS family arabinose efflux permease
VFLGLVPLPLIAAALALPAMRRLDRVSAAPRDWWRALAAVRLALGAGLALTGLGLASPLFAAALVLVGGAIGLPALRQLLPAGTLRAAPGLPAAIATHGLLNLAFFGVDAFVPLMLTAVRNQTVTFAGLALTAATITWTTGAWVQAHFAPTGHRRRVVVVGLALIAAGIAVAAAVLSPTVPAALALVAWAIAGLGIGLGFSTNSLVVLETAPPGQEGTASAAMQLANGLGIALGAGIGGVFVGSASAGGSVSVQGLLTQDLLMISVAGLAVLAAQRLPGRRRPA